LESEKDFSLVVYPHDKSHNPVLDSNDEFVLKSLIDDTPVIVENSPHVQNIFIYDKPEDGKIHIPIVDIGKDKVLFANGSIYEFSYVYTEGSIKMVHEFPGHLTLYLSHSPINIILEDAPSSGYYFRVFVSQSKIFPFLKSLNDCKRMFTVQYKTPYILCNIKAPSDIQEWNDTIRKCKEISNTIRLFIIHSTRSPLLYGQDSFANNAIFEKGVMRIILSFLS
jgi:hypothetical protein